MERRWFARAAVEKEAPPHDAGAFLVSADLQTG
jgi:hypothetical protein